MGAVSLTMAGQAPQGPVQAQLTLIGDNDNIILPITSPAATYSSLEGNWVQVPRPGKKPMLVRVSPKLSTLALEVKLVAPDGSVTDPGNFVQPIFKQFLDMANADGVAPIALSWGSMDGASQLTSSGHWRINTLEIASEHRQPGTNNISQATVNVTLIEVSDPPGANVVSASFGQPAGSSPTATAAPGVRPPGSYTVVSGDTLWGIAQKVYGQPVPGWTRIATANGIADPRTIKPGQILSIP